MLAATKQCTCTHKAFYVIICRHDCEQGCMRVVAAILQEFKQCTTTYKVGFPYMGSHFMLTSFVVCLNHYTNCRHQASCIDGIWSRTFQIPVSLNQFEPVHFVESTVSIYVTSVVLKKFIRCLIKNENDRGSIKCEQHSIWKNCIPFHAWPSEGVGFDAGRTCCK